MSEENTPDVAAEIPVPDATATPEPTETLPEPEKTFTQKELDEILEKRLGKERRKREDLQRRLSVTEELALKARAPEPPKAEAGEPKREKFDDYEEYLEARTDFRAEKKAEQVIAKNREQEKASSAKAEHAKVTEAFQKRIQEASKGIGDFEETLSSSDATVTQAMSEAILHSDAGPQVAYHLAKNPDEAERIAALPAARQIAEITKLEMKLGESKPTPTRPASKAPEPIRPVKGNTGVADAEPTDPNEWRLWRLRQKMARNKG